MNDQQQSRADALTYDQRQALGEALAEYFGKLDSDEGIRTPEGRILRTFDYCDSRTIDDLIDRAIVPAIAAPPLDHISQAGKMVDEQAAFEAHYAKMWNAAYNNTTNHTAADVAELREGDTYGEDRTYLNASWEGWQARAASAIETGAEGAHDARRMRTLCRLLDAMDDFGNGFPGEVHAAFQDGGKRTRAALDDAAIPEDFGCSPAMATEASQPAQQPDERAPEAAAIGEHDLSMSDGGRSYVAEFFAKRLHRHEFGSYIKERLAADFACALAQYLSDRDTVPQPPSPTTSTCPSGDGSLRWPCPMHPPRRTSAELTNDDKRDAERYRAHIKYEYETLYMPGVEKKGLRPLAFAEYKASADQVADAAHAQGSRA
ncbi:hypothetical protein WS72_11615 [Burkholderia savannae]|uniref:Uncharacterized protein n=1 Tax=Burkholderia savannae TaxID=1637837 RepID=A0ABR5TEL4_9BURK|nr:hypothetical protein [Burkholderia savannae]KWZ43442.1 hypothetical protein WS72_11615 [Burkholderia savannae]KWZ46463.1 hypothetical protein WS73_20740 [Burkholderia savannae]